MILVSETHPFARRIPHVHVRSSPQRPRSERRCQIARVEITGHAGPRDFDNDTLAMIRIVGPIRRWMLGTEDEHNFHFARMKRGDAAAGAVAGFVEHADLAGAHAGHFNARAVEDVSGV